MRDPVKVLGLSELHKVNARRGGGRFDFTCGYSAGMAVCFKTERMQAVLNQHLLSGKPARKLCLFEVPMTQDFCRLAGCAFRLHDVRSADFNSIFPMIDRHRTGHKAFPCS